MSSKRLGKGLRDQLRIHQVLAECHYRQRLRSPGLILPTATPVCGDPVPNPPEQNSMHCPFCALRKPFDELGIEHGPQRGGQSRLGPDVVAVLSCKRCNNDSKYEAAAAAIARGDEPDELAELTADELAELTERRKLLEQIIEVDVEMVPLAYELTDLKAPRGRSPPGRCKAATSRSPVGMTGGYSSWTTHRGRDGG